MNENINLDVIETPPLEPSTATPALKQVAVEPGSVRQ